MVPDAASKDLLGGRAAHQARGGVFATRLVHELGSNSWHGSARTAISVWIEAGRKCTMSIMTLSKANKKYNKDHMKISRKDHMKASGENVVVSSLQQRS